MQPVYIISSCSISAQHTYEESSFLSPVVSSDDKKLYVADADYTRYISPVAIRRMSRMLKRGITTGMSCMENAGIKTPDAIIIGTSRGSVTDMELFLHDMIDLGEQALNPTYFIQSTYNSVNGWLAMLTKCNAYNQTFVHKGFSFELCLLDAQLFLSESAETKKILVGGFDELTPEYYLIREKIGFYKAAPLNSQALLENGDTPGSIGGEGAQFFVMSNDPAGAACSIHSVTMLHKPTLWDVQNSIDSLLTANNLRESDIDVLLSGINGDGRNNLLVSSVHDRFSSQSSIAYFKHLCGEYDTAAAFGLWLGDYLFRKQEIATEILLSGRQPNGIHTMLFFNINIVGNVSLVLLRSV